MDNNYRRPVLGVGLPVAVAQDLGVDVNPIQTFFRHWKVIFARKKVAGQRHNVAIAQIAARNKWIENGVSWIFSHAGNQLLQFAYNNDAVIILNEPAICRFLNTCASNATTSLKPS